MGYRYNLTKFINEQIKNKNTITEFGLNDNYEGCTGCIEFADNTCILIGSDYVCVYDKNNNDITDECVEREF